VVERQRFCGKNEINQAVVALKDDRFVLLGGPEEERLTFTLTDNEILRIRTSIRKDLWKIAKEPLAIKDSDILRFGQLQFQIIQSLSSTILVVGPLNPCLSDATQVKHYCTLCKAFIEAGDIVVQPCECSGAALTQKHFSCLQKHILANATLSIKKGATTIRVKNHTCSVCHS
jgi:hypothetical protein